jgi:transcriptional regulator with GAF, ATPase, and Fis domain
VLARAGSTLRIGRTLLYVVDDVAPYATDAPLDDVLVGGAALSKVRAEIAAVGPSHVSVLIEGETGTGKEVVAQAIHRASARGGELCALNCAAMPEDLVESELFGHTRGAFSGSDRTRRGLFRAADGGTLLLDEIGDLPAEAQAKLLRALETGEVRAVGEDRALHVDVRVLAATNKELEQLVAQGRFRADLFHRIATARIALPPLRDRREDVPLLAARFAGSLEIGLQAMERLVATRFAGNVRELKNAVELGAARARARKSDSIELEDLSLPEPDAVEGEDTSDARLIAALEAAGGNVTQVARDLGMRRPTVYERLRRMGRDPTSFRKR